MLKICGVIILIIVLGSCQKSRDTLFVKLSPQQTGITFNNTIQTNQRFNAINFEYIYNGAGVGVADFNQDSLPDLFFAGNMVSSRLYLNQGNLKFTDVTEQAGVTTDQWCTGVSLVDINQDNLIDIYISVAGLEPGEARQNIFFINQGLENGVPRFTNKAAKMGVADTSYSTMAIFLDYDKDNDLDLYVMNNALEKDARNAVRPLRKDGSAPSNDHLFQNHQGLFTEVSQSAGISIEGYGLGVTICDLNQDQWPDIYVANDFLTNDVLWINQRDGTFKNQISSYFKHQAHSSMGLDLADYNNDMLDDLIVLDMLPQTNQRMKMMIPNRNYDKFHMGLKLGYQAQFPRNNLQLNQGRFPDGFYKFSEVGFLADVAQTDWSWAPLLADLDNDGWKDLYIANGYRKDITNLDFIVFSLQGAQIFGTDQTQSANVFTEIEKLPEIKLSNYAFRNEKDLTFANFTKDWGLDIPSYSNGAVYTDLDLDGDLDLVMNNIDDPAFIFKNTLMENQNTAANYLQVHLQAPDLSQKLNATVNVFTENGPQQLRFNPYRGYRSTVDQNYLHFGLGSIQMVDSLVVNWPDGKTNTSYRIKTNQIITIDYQDGNFPAESEIKGNIPNYDFEEVADMLNINYVHREQKVIDFKKTPLLQHMLSQSGPALAVGDINGDGLDDFFVGAEANQSGIIFIQKNGKFEKRIFDQDAVYEDAGALLFDADGDADLDLYLVSGGSMYPEQSELYQDRLYLNDGEGVFTRDKQALPDLKASGSIVTAGDYDQDGDLDLFVGGKIRPDNYPLSPESYLLNNDKGKFTDVTDQLNASLGKSGMVSAALWTDYNNDRLLDLILVGEWMPVMVYRNDGSKFTQAGSVLGFENTAGWWNSISGADLDQDGDTDYVLGNVGLNTFFEPTTEQPVQLYANDFDKNGSLDPVMTYFNQGQEFIIHPLAVLTDQMPFLRSRFQRFNTYSKTPFIQSFTTSELEGHQRFSCQMLGSAILKNNRDKGMELIQLPIQAQFSAVYGLQITDHNMDGLPDIVLAGNSFAEETIRGWYDASYGLVLENQGAFNFKPVKAAKSGFVVSQDAKALARLIYADGEQITLASQNNGPLKVFRSTTPIHQLIHLKPDDWFAQITYSNGQSEKREFFYGSGYWSQSSRYLCLSAQAEKVKIFNYTGQSRKVSPLNYSMPPVSHRND
ncbi:MAG: FG-GAP-like repeat-containing protein [Candidatus Cyclobacteriaceae bacterium M3_2C_046]